MKQQITYSKYTVIIVFIQYYFIAISLGKDLKFAIPKLEGCAILGLPNATINECGYCVGEGTALSNDYGKDCRGVCFGGAQYDCMEQCDGKAYVDECTGICIDPSDAQSQVNGSVNRDCRGMCIPPELSRPQQQAYDRDECGVCRLQSSDPSSFIDCNGNCQLPGIEKATMVCGHCVDKNISISHVLDECGNCRSEKKYCSCDKDVSICGCNDPNNCHNVRSLIPSAVPNRNESKILLLGYFHPVMRNLHCILQHQLTGVILSFPVSFIHKNKTAIECLVTPQEVGIYNLGLSMNKSSKEIIEENFVHLISYNISEVTISSMGPLETLTTNHASTVILKFTDPTNSMPPLPLKCKVRYSDGREELTMEGSDAFTCILHSSPQRSISQNLLITPSYDGINPLSYPFTFTIKAPHPTISQQNCYVSEDGLTIVIIFESPIKIERDMNNATSLCEYLLTPVTLEYLSLYDLQNCFWASKTQLLIFTEKPIPETSVIIKINRRVIREDRQSIALENDKELEVTAKKLFKESDWFSYEPMVAITGPSEIPRCGSFALIGHFSSPKGTTDVQFQWEVIRDDRTVSTELKQYVESNGKSTNLLLTSSLFEIHVPYKFFFRAYISTVDQTLVASHTLIRLNYDSPLVSIYHTTLLHPTPLSVDQEVQLFADVTVPECVHPVQRVGIFWKVIDPQILFPLKNNSISSLSYTIKPYSVPIEKPVGFYLNAFFGHRYSETSGAAFSLITTEAPLKATIANGSPNITIGSKSGLFELSGEDATARKRKKLVYQWSCHESKTAQPCYYNFAYHRQLSETDRQREPLLLTQSLQRQSTLRLDSSMFEPNKQYWFGLQIFHANDSARASETEYTLVKVVDDNAPQVFVGPVYVKGMHRVAHNPRLSATIVPAQTSVTIKGIIKPANNVAMIKWESPHSTFPLLWQNKIVNNEIHSELILHQNHILPLGIYLLKLNACNAQQKCSDADISLMASQRVSMCQVVVEPYIEYELTLAFVQNCNTPPGYAPLTYQLFLADESLDSPIPITVPQFSSVLTFPGTPVATAGNKQLTRFGVNVCDRFEYCRMFYSQSVNIEKGDNETASIEHLLKIAKRYNTAGDSIAAMSVLLGPLSNPFCDKYLICERVINDSIKYAVDALMTPSLLFSDGHINIAYFTLSSAINKTKHTFTKKKLLSSIQKFTQIALGSKKPPQLSTIKTIYPIVMETFRRTPLEKKLNKTLDQQLLNDLRKTTQLLISVAASQIQLGTSEKFGEHIDDAKDNIAMTEIIHDFQVRDLKLKARLNKTQMVEVIIKFGEEVKDRFSRPWDCQQPVLCQSVVFSVTIYPDENPYLELEGSFKLSPVVDITIHAPNTGKEQKMEGFLKAAIFEITLLGNATEGGRDMITRCHYFDESDETWKIDGIHPLGVENGNVGCWTGHLSTFVALRIVEGISADYVIGVMVAVIMGVLVFAIMVVFFIQKKREDAARVAPQITSHKPSSRSPPKKQTPKQEYYQNSHKNSQTNHSHNPIPETIS